MTHYRILPAILSGGSGTRLWPASTDAKPKQFHALAGPRALIADTLLRHQEAGSPLSFTAPLVLCSSDHKDHVGAALREAGVAPRAVVYEPAPRNTAPIAAIAAALAQELEPDALVLLSPADHVIRDRAAFWAAIERAAPIARERIVTFGIRPHRPETGYGYIKRGAPLAEGVFEIEQFREKPDLQTAEALLADGGYDWNAGIFLFDPNVLLAEFKHSVQVRDAALAALRSAERQGVHIHLEREAFLRAPALPLDIAVMEKTRRAAVAPCDLGWADLGSWEEIWRLSPKDEFGNATRGPTVALDTANSLIWSDGIKVCVAGVSDLVVVATRDGVLVVPRHRAQDTKALVELLRKQ